MSVTPHPLDQLVSQVKCGADWQIHPDDEGPMVGLERVPDREVDRDLLLAWQDPGPVRPGADAEHRIRGEVDLVRHPLVSSYRPRLAPSSWSRFRATAMAKKPHPPSLWLDPPPEPGPPLEGAQVRLRRDRRRLHRPLGGAGNGRGGRRRDRARTTTRASAPLAVTPATSSRRSARTSPPCSASMAASAAAPWCGSPRKQ
jgi:hypothetical protein